MCTWLLGEISKLIELVLYFVRRFINLFEVVYLCCRGWVFMVKHAIVLADEDWYKAMASNLKMYITLYYCYC